MEDESPTLSIDQISQFILLTSQSPSNIRMEANKYGLILAAGGVINVNNAVANIPPPNKFFPPYFVANHPPGIWVNI